MGEFELIAAYFSRPVGAPVVLGGGDDCAQIQGSARDWAVSTDMLVAGRHFLPDTSPADLGWKSLAVNLSDLAAAGAEPVAFTLALALPGVDRPWLEAFSEGLYDCAKCFGIQLCGGDTTAGPLTISITVFGYAPPAGVIRRSGAAAGDEVWVSGTLGDAALGLSLIRSGADVSEPSPAALVSRLQRPTPRVALGQALASRVTSMIDLSDGLAGDLGHICAKSRLGAEVDLDALPVSEAMAHLGAPNRHQLMVGGGDDYELCFTAPPSARGAIEDLAGQLDERVSRVGVMTSAPGIVWRGATDAIVNELRGTGGFDHFR